ncbi:hypothetical protein BB560_004033, partial [Smittium megazygosporum]
MNKTIFFVAIQLLLLLGLVFAQNDDPGRNLRPNDDGFSQSPRPNNDASITNWPGDGFWRRRCFNRDSFCDKRSWRGYYECFRGRYVYRTCPR